jgi:predicted Zn-dependent protease
VRDGVLVGYQLDRQMAHKQRFGRSNGCAFADQAGPRAAAADAECVAQRERQTGHADDLLSGMGEGLYIVGDKSWSIDMQRYNFQFTGQQFFQVRGGKIVGQVKDVAYQSRTTDFWNSMEAVGGPSTYCARRRVQLRQGAARTDCARVARMSCGALQTDQHPQHRAGGVLTLQDTIDRVLRLSRADACVVIARRVSGVNVRWAHNTVTTNGDADEAQLSVVSIIGRRVASVTRTYFPAEQLEEIVREAEAACERKPDAPDYLPLVEGNGEPGDWGEPPADSDIHIFDPFVPQLKQLYEDARRADIATFGYSEFQTATTFVATTTGVRKRYTERIGKVEITGKTPDFRAVGLGWPDHPRFPRHRRTRDVRDAAAAPRVGGAHHRYAGRGLRSAAGAVGGG